MRIKLQILSRQLEQSKFFLIECHRTETVCGALFEKDFRKPKHFGDHL